MTINITLENLYLLIIALLMVMQIYQFTLVSKLKKDLDSMWQQMGIITIAISTKFGEVMAKKKEEDGK